MGLYSAALCLTSLLQYGASFDLPATNCSNTVDIDGVHYTHTETTPMSGYPSDAHYDAYGNLFYVKTGRNLDGYFFDIYIVKSQSKSPVKIDGIPEGQGYSVAVDRKESQVYFGTEFGVFKYDYETDSAAPTGSASEKISMIFIDRNSTKYITKPNDGLDELYLLQNNQKLAVASIRVLSDMAIDERNNLYFIKENQLFLLQSGQTAASLVMDVQYTGTGQISFDMKGTVYVAMDKMRYFSANDARTMREVDSVPRGITALAFDKDGNFVLGLDGKLMKYEKVNCYSKQ